MFQKVKCKGSAFVPVTLDAYQAGISAFNASQPNTSLLESIRAYNHSVVDAFNQMRPIEGKVVLDVGASPHGYALEQALTLGAAAYIGVGLDVDQPVVVSGPTGVGKLRNADAEALPFDDCSIDLVLSMSTFEHVAHVDRCLKEIWRVLRPGGATLATFEPIWTCSYGHHLHHFGPVASAMPDWAHLLWSKEEMLANLRDVWPQDDSLTLDDAATWVYDSIAINRIGVRMMKQHFEQSTLTVEWMVELRDTSRDAQRLAAVSASTGLTPDELMTKGLSVLMTRT